MKEIKNWEAVIKNEKGDEQIAILLPGCIIKGQIENEEVEVETKDIDISNLIVVDLEEQKYMLLGANKEYLNNLVKCIEIGRKERDGEER